MGRSSSMPFLLHRFPAVGGLLLFALFCAARVGAEYFSPHGATITVINTTDNGVADNRTGNPTPAPSVTPTPAGFGGGIATGTGWEGSLTIHRTTIRDNTATGMFGYGGGIWNLVTHPVTIIESTITNNHADDDGGGINVFI